MELKISGIPLLLVAIMLMSSPSADAQIQRYGGSGARFKRPFAPSLEGSAGYRYPQPTPLSYNSAGSGYNSPRPSYVAPVAPPSVTYSGRPFGLPEEKSRFLHSGYTYHLPAADPPPPPVKSSYISKPYSDYVITFGSGNRHQQQVSVLNRPVAPSRPSFSTGVVGSSYLTAHDPPPPPSRYPEDVVNVQPPLTSVYVITASDKNEGAKEAFVGLHKEPAFGSVPDKSVIKPLTPNVVYTPNQAPSGEQGDDFRPMYIFGPVFYPKSNKGKPKDNSESESNQSSVLKTPSASSDSVKVAESPSVTTTTTPVPSSGDTAAKDNMDDEDVDKVVDEELEEVDDEESEDDGGGGRGIIGVIKHLFSEKEENVDDTNSRVDSNVTVKDADNDAGAEVDHTSKADVEEVEYEPQDDNVDKPKEEAVKKVQKSSNKKDRNQAVRKVVKVPVAEDKKQTDVNAEPVRTSGPLQSLDEVKSEHEHAVNNEEGDSINSYDPDPIVGPLQIGFIGAPPTGAEQFGPMRPYFYPAGIPYYNNPQINPFSMSGFGYSNDGAGFETEQMQQQQQPQRFTPEMIQHEQEKIQQTFEQQRNQQTFEQQQNQPKFEQQSFQEVESTQKNIIEDTREVQMQVESSPKGQNVEPPAQVEQGITMENKKASTTEQSFDHTVRYDDLSAVVATDSAASSMSIGHQQEESTAYADNYQSGSFFTDVSPAPQTLSPLQIEKDFGPTISAIRDEVATPSTTPTVSTRKPFPSFHQRKFRTKNRNYVAPTTYRPSYPRTSPADDHNALNNEKDNSATFYNSIHYQQQYDVSTSPPQVQYEDKPLETANSDIVVQRQEAPYGSRIQSRYDVID